VRKEAPRIYPTWTASASFTLHEGNFPSNGVIQVVLQSKIAFVTIIRSHSADSQLSLEGAKEPKARQISMLLDFARKTELLHLAASVTAAELRVAKKGYRNTGLEIVGFGDGDGAGGLPTPPRSTAGYRLPFRLPCTPQPTGFFRVLSKGRSQGQKTQELNMQNIVILAGGTFWTCPSFVLVMCS
jgi:hypothetical protein